MILAVADWIIVEVINTGAAIGIRSLATLTQSVRGSRMSTSSVKLITSLLASGIVSNSWSRLLLSKCGAKSCGRSPFFFANFLVTPQTLQTLEHEDQYFLSRCDSFRPERFELRVKLFCKLGGIIHLVIAFLYLLFSVKSR
jgi:hypothetical protein